MLNAERQQKLDTILEELRSIAGVESVTSDDFDSNYVNVFVNLRPTKMARMGYGTTEYPQGFERHMRSLKSDVRKVKGFTQFLDWPEVKYESDGMGGRFRLGYDQSYFKIEVQV